MSVIVLIGGGHACGKKTAAMLLEAELLKILGSLNIKLIDMENYVIPGSIKSSIYSSSKSSAITVSDITYPPLKPSRYDFAKLRNDLVSGDNELIIVHGLYALYDKQLREMSKLKVFISSDADTRLIRWIRRDVVNGDKSISLEMVINKYLQGARAEMNDFINPTKEFSDVIMPTGPESNAINLLVDGIMPYLSQGSVSSYSIPVYQDDKRSFYELN